MIQRLVSIVFCLLVVLPAGAQQEEARILKGDTRVPIAGPAPAGWEFLWLPIDDDLRATLEAQRRAAKTTHIAATYTSILKPSITGGIDAFDVSPLSFAAYYQGVVVFNTSSSSRSVTVTVKTSGASHQTISGRFVLPPNSMGLALGQFKPFGVGVVFLKTQVTGAKAVTSAVCSGC